jgi:NitT/TauT family transport system substrate-binding protein
MGCRVVGGLLPLLLLVAAGPAAAQLTKVKFGTALSPPSLDSITPYVARDRGLFRKYGLEVEILEFRGDAIATKALVAGEVEVAIFGATSAIVSAAKGPRSDSGWCPSP